MKYHVFGDDQPEYPICFLVPYLRADLLKKEYIEPFGLDPETVIFIQIPRPEGKKKASASEMKDWITNELKAELDALQVNYLFVASSEHFKHMVKAPKAEARLGYVDKNIYGDWHTLYVPAAEQVFHDPIKIREKIHQGVNAAMQHADGDYIVPGTTIIEYEEYPDTVEKIRDWLDHLHTFPKLGVDTETFSLKHYSAGIGTITFAWSKTEGIAFSVDYGDFTEEEIVTIRYLLMRFFIEYEGTLVYHNAAFDITVLIYQLFMRNILDTKGLLDGLQVMLKNWEDTQLVTYFATNTCAGNKLSLKDQAQEYAGDYAQSEITDITKIPVADLLRYNLVDGISTLYVLEKHWDTMIADEQFEIYQLYKEWMWEIIQMQLTGMPIDMDRVHEVDRELQKYSDNALAKILSTPLMRAFTHELMIDEAEKKNAKLKKKRVTAEEMTHVVFNPNSAVQIGKFLYEYLGLPILDKTPSGAGSTGADSIKKLMNLVKDPEALAIMEGLLAYAEVAILLSTFMPAFKRAEKGPDGWHYLFGNFKLGGTQSGRLSSQGPNMQNIPATKDTIYTKMVKSCFRAPPGWFFCGIDFASLEDRISALLTKDPNKLKIYTDGYDGHSLRAYFYFRDQMPDIDPDSVESINSIAKKYKPLRQDSKTPTFLLTYDGTHIGIMQQMGWEKDKAISVEESYKEMYKVSREYVNQELENASRTGYVICAFGLRLRTPKLAQVIRGTKNTPHGAVAEGRSAGNALGQSYGMLNNRAAHEFMEKVRHGKYAHDIKICAQIHDAQYYLIRDDSDTLLYANTHLIEAVCWQDDPKIWHDEVKLGGEFSIFYPTWKEEVSIPNGADEDQLREAFLKHLEELNENT